MCVMRWMVRHMQCSRVQDICGEVERNRYRDKRARASCVRGMRPVCLCEGHTDNPTCAHERIMRVCVQART